MRSSPQAILQPRRARPFIFGHPWVFSGSIDRIEGKVSDGQELDLCDSTGSFIARGLFNSKSQIQVRLYTWNPEQPLDRAFFESRVRRALEFRSELRKKKFLAPEEACRLINSEGDGLSGLVLDCYPPYSVVQFMALGLDQRREELLPLIAELSGISNLYERSDGPICRYEGLAERRGLVLGQQPPALHPFQENGFTFLVDISKGHKTGYYLDQRENRGRAAQWAQSGRILDAFCYTGSFGIHAARAGASILAIDESASALEVALENARANGLPEGGIQTRRASAVPEMQRLLDSGEKFNTIILDPPKFAHTKHELERALHGYREINLLALLLLEGSGLLFTCSCSGAVPLEMFQDVLHEAAHEAHRELQILEIRSQSQDHPVSICCPESRYLKCLICRVY